MIFLGIRWRWPKWLRQATRRIEFKRVPAKANWVGIPKPDLTHEEVWTGIKSTITPMTIETMLSHCPVCGDELVKYRSAYEVHEEGSAGQYDVCGEYCAKGHYTHLDCA